ncbi:MAG TPA: 50S ribosomal protein L18 [Candidatus Dormibacteraeota bacterium]|jgi:large subunit ribosomal protein L18|nr:50S ribosomal protein L18 [Candidatus Dormibacteraeota bacterium]
MFTKHDRRTARAKRHRRVRKRVEGIEARPRLAVHRSLHHITAQVIDDVRGHTMASASTVEGELKGSIKGGTSNATAASAVGRALAQRAIAAGVKTVVFDRGGYLYHGRVKALADAAREAGLEF